MPAYLIGKMSITDPEAYSRYKEITPKIIEKFGGRFLTRGGGKITLEGNEEKRRVVIVEFENSQRAEEFYRSKEYQEAIAIRKNAATMDLMIIGGFE